MLKRILLLDDDSLFREAVSLDWCNAGLEVLQAESCAQARTLLGMQSFDLLIIDGQLPDINGLAFIAELRGSGFDKPIIFISGAWIDAVEHAQVRSNLSVSVIIHKPITSQALYFHIAQLLHLEPGIRGRHESMTALQKLSSRFFRTLPSEMRKVISLLEPKLDEHPFDPQSWQECCRAAHMLRGSAGSYGFNYVTRLMGRLEEHLSLISGDQKPPKAAFLETTRSILAQIASTADFIDRSKGTPPTDESLSTGTKALLLSENKIVLKAVETVVSGAGDTRVTFCMSAEQLFDAARMVKFDLVVLECARVDEEIVCANEKLHRFISKVRKLQGYERVSIVLLTNAYMKPGLRLFLGVRDLISLPPSPGELAASMHNNLVRSDYSTAALFHPAEEFAANLKAALKPELIDLACFQSTTDFEQKLESVKPSFLLLHLGMPGISGLDLCRKLKGGKRWKNMPILIIVDGNYHEYRVAALECGADDALSEPLEERELLLKLKKLDITARTRQELKMTDQASGLLNHGSFFDLCQQRIKSQRNYAWLGLGLIKLEDFALFNSTFGETAGNEVLRITGSCLKGRFSPDAVRGRWSCSEFAVFCSICDHDSFKLALQMLIEELANELQKYCTSPPVLKCCFSVQRGAGGDFDDLLRSARNVWLHTP